MKCLLVFLSVIVFCTSIQAQDVKAKQNEKQRLEKEIQFIDKQIKGLSNKEKTSTKHLNLIRKKAANRQSILKSLDKKIADLDTQIVEKENIIARTQAELDTLTDYYTRLIYNCYKNRDSRMWFMYILASEDVGQGYRRMRYLSTLSEAVNRQGRQIRELGETLAREKEELEAARSEAAEVHGKREKEYKKLLAEEKQSRKVIYDISKNKAKYQKELAKRRKAVDNLNREIQKMLNSAVKGSGKKKLSAAEVALTGEFSQNKGKLGWPVSTGVITEHFGVHYHPVFKNIKLPENNGVTIETARNAKVHCVFRGVVKQMIVMPGYNHCVLVQHGNYYTFYCKLKSVNVKTGQNVEAGTMLGTLEEDGNGSSIHFQIWEGTTKQNPESWLR